MANSKKLNKLKNKGKFSMNDFFNNINTNKYFIGLMMIFMNLGSRFIELNLTKGQEMIFKNVAREVLIFTIAFMGSRDIFIALVITAVFIILSNFVFNENCKYNILPENSDTITPLKGSQEHIKSSFLILVPFFMFKVEPYGMILELKIFLES